MAAPAHIAALQALLANQQGAHTGLPGGLGDAMTEAQRAVLLTHASRFKCENVRVACTVAPDEPDAHETIHKHIQALMHKLITSKWYLKELEDVALEWLAMQFQGRAADHWARVVGAARVTATTSGIGHNSVLYRCLLDMLLAYPATGIKVNLLLRKVLDLPWKSKATVVNFCFCKNNKRTIINRSATRRPRTTRPMIAELRSPNTSTLPSWCRNKTGRHASPRCKYIFQSGLPRI
jgi:hypothetical protein